MTPLEMLEMSGDAMSAKTLARELGMDIIEVYSQLVQAEATGKAHVGVSYTRQQRPVCEWRAGKPSKNEQGASDVRRTW